jgi:hypothetical protein
MKKTAKIILMAENIDIQEKNCATNFKAFILSLISEDWETVKAKSHT